MSVQQENFQIERTLKHTPSRVFRAFTETKELALWSPPDESMKMRIESGSCSVGERLLWTCGPGEAEGIRVCSDYFYVEKDSELLFSEAVYYQENLLSVALINVKFLGTRTTELRIKVQLSAVDSDMIKDYQGGWSKSLENLIRLLG